MIRTMTAADLAAATFVGAGVGWARLGATLQILLPASLLRGRDGGRRSNLGHRVRSPERGAGWIEMVCVRPGRQEGGIEAGS